MMCVQGPTGDLGLTGEKGDNGTDGGMGLKVSTIYTICILSSSSKTYVCTYFKGRVPIHYHCIFQNTSHTFNHQICLQFLRCSLDSESGKGGSVVILHMHMWIQCAGASHTLCD